MAKRDIPLDFRLTLPPPDADKLLWVLFSLSLFVDAALWIYLGVRMSSLPEVLAIHYDSIGRPDRTGFRSQLFVLPIIGLVSLAVNATFGLALYRYERQLTYLLLGVALLVQALT